MGGGGHNNVANLNVLAFYPVGDDCITFWDNEAQTLIERVINDFGHRNNLLYVVSAGPMSEPIIASLYRNNPENCYIDFGSSIDIYIHGQDRRPYTKHGTVYSQRNCWMFDPKTTNFDVSVVLSSYKKPDALSLQLEAIESQTLKPKEILLLQDGIDSNYKITFNPEFLDKFTSVVISPTNRGVWERFRFAMQSQSEYVCIFDDDTIPGKRWLENCHFNAQLQEGIYGTVGVIIRKPPIYPQNYWRFGWPRAYSKTVRVDIAGHSWFVKREYLEWMFDGTEKYQAFKYVGEDMCLSFKAQQHGISTLIPPHPFHDTELWGSLPEYALKYGLADTAVSLNSVNTKAMSEAMRLFASDGFKFCMNEHFAQTWSVHLLSKFENFRHRVRRKLRRLKNKLKGQY